jgi:hypothetical protein
MDVVLPNGLTFTLLSLVDGTASLYFGSGGAVLGGHGYDHVRRAVGAFVAKANQFHQSMFQVADSPLPAKGNVAFYGRTDAGLLHGAAREEDLSTGRHPLGPLHVAGHSVITELRKASQFKAWELN